MKKMLRCKMIISQKYSTLYLFSSQLTESLSLYVIVEYAIKQKQTWFDSSEKKKEYL